jgi:hypothetical protein
MSHPAATMKPNYQGRFERDNDTSDGFIGAGPCRGGASTRVPRGRELTMARKLAHLVNMKAGDRPTLEGSPAQTAGALNLDDLVAVAQLIEGVTGRSLTPDESSRLKSAYQAARNRRGGATLHAITSALRGQY